MAIPGAVNLTTLTGTETVGAETGGAVKTQCQAVQLRDASGYQKSVATTGFTINAANGTSVIALNPAGTLATGTINFPTAPVDGQRLLIFSSQTQTALTLAVTTGQTLNNAVTSLTANVAVEYIYSLSNTTWDRCS